MDSVYSCLSDSLYSGGATFALVALLALLALVALFLFL